MRRTLRLVGERSAEVPVEPKHRRALFQRVQARPPRTSLTGWRRSSNDVTTPKLPPPPRSAPEQVWIVGGVGLANCSVRGDDIGRDQVVDCEPMLAHQPAQTATERETGDSGVGDCASRCRKSEHLGFAVQFAPENTAFSPYRSALRVYADALHWRHVNDEAPVVGPIAWRTMASAAHRDLETLSLRELHRALNVGTTGTARNQRWSSIDIPVPHPPGRFVASVPT